MWREPAGVLVDSEARNSWPEAMPDVEHTSIRAERQESWSPLNWHRSLRRKPAVIGIYSEGRYLVFVLQANVQRAWHLFISLRFLGHPLWVKAPQLLAEDRELPRQCYTGRHDSNYWGVSQIPCAQ